jgi:hypothetical protein
MSNKVALLIVGQPRTFEFCFPSLKQNILDVYQPDIFICTDDMQCSKIKELYKPIGLACYNQEDNFDYAYQLRYGIPSVLAVNDLSVAWKLNRAALLKKEYELVNGFIYDTVIVTRFDVKIKHIPVIKAKGNTFHVPTIGGYWTTPPDKPGIHWGGYSAHLCWSTSEIIDKISNLYFDNKDYLTLATNSGVQYGWTPEYVLKYFCDVNSIDISFEDINMMLIRGTNNNPLSFDNSPLKNYPEYL